LFFGKFNSYLIRQIKAVKI